MKNMHNDNRPLVLLDVDGVINDLGPLGGTSRPWNTDVLTSHGYRLHIPDYMKRLIFALTMCTDVRWCTTWRERANDEIADHLGIGKLPVVTDGSASKYVDWKASAARPLVIEALDAGREVFWIEDFYGDPPREQLPAGVTYIDTTVMAPRGVLTAQDLPRSLVRHLAGWPWPTARETEPTSNSRGGTPWDSDLA